MATRLLAFSGLVFAGVPAPKRGMHSVEADKCRAMRRALFRTAAIPAVLAIVAGGLILSREAQTNPQLAGTRSGVSEAVARFTPPRVIDLMRKVARTSASLDDEDHDPDQAAVTWARRIPEEELRRVLATSPKDGSTILQFGPMRIRRDLVETIVRAAHDTDTDPALLMSIADKESSFAPTVKASTSSATGLVQFIDTTWLRVVRDFGVDHGLAREAAQIEGPDDRPYIADPATRQRILGLRNDPYLSAILAAEMLKHDGARIAGRIGRDLTDGETYLAHFLGPGDAEKFITKMVEEPKFAAPRLLPRPARANRSIFFAASHRKARSLSVADVHKKFEAMIGLRSERYRDVEKVTGVNAYAD